MIDLPDVTLIAASGTNIDKTIGALLWSCKNINFTSVKLITHQKPDNLPENIEFEQSSFIMNSYNKYNEYMFLEMEKHVNTSHCLVIQHDGFVIHPDLWNNEWLSIDYLGAPWAIRENAYMANNGERARIGNGGFSLRSRFLLGLPKKLGLYLTQEQNYFCEDGNINCYWRKELLNAGIKYGTIKMASHFSFETEVEENKTILETFGFHAHLRPKEYLLLRSKIESFGNK
jgi:hypothetical protein